MKKKNALVKIKLLLVKMRSAIRSFSVSFVMTVFSLWQIEEYIDLGSNFDGNCNKLMGVIVDGRSGNQLSHYATLLVLSKQFEYMPVIHPDTKSVLETYFEGISIPTYEEIGLFRCSICT